MSYRRFPSGAEALRFAVERQAAERLSTTIIETDEVRIEGDEIARLYASDTYPFERGTVRVALRTTQTRIVKYAPTQPTKIEDAGHD